MTQQKSGFKVSLFACLAFTATTNLFGQAKVALVIGIRNYQKVAPLQNSVNDAHDMAAALKSKGFQVIELYDAKTKKELQDAVRKYFAMLQGQANGVGLMFYSGHGMQVDGDNYLIPTTVDLQIKADVQDQCLNMSYIMSAIEEASNSLNIFILDACRNNPFRSFSRSGEKGLSMVNAPKGSYIVYATKPGSVASDGTERNGLFTSKLLKHINTPDLNIEQVFKRVASDVGTASNDSQRPWISSDYTGDFYFTSDKLVSVPQNNLQSVSSQAEMRGLDFGYGASNSTLIMGDQEWTAKNLNVSKFANGDPIPEAKTDQEWEKALNEKKPAWCYYANDSTNGSKFGKLYNWFAVNDSRGLAPIGWHVPTLEDWEKLIIYLGGEHALIKSNKIYLDLINVGTEKKGKHFAAPPGGYRTNRFGGGGIIGFWWSSSPYIRTKVKSVLLSHESNSIWSFKSTDNYTWQVALGKRIGLSVLCLRD